MSNWQKDCKIHDYKHQDKDQIIIISDGNHIEDKRSYSEGSRNKSTIYFKESNQIIKKNTRYLVKKSSKTREIELWVEFASYKLACLLGIKVAHTFIGRYKGSDDIVILSEWCYDDTEATTINGFNLMLQDINITTTQQNVKHGENHTYDNVIHKLFISKYPNLLQDFLNYLFFDALIGNTDRHHENWAFIKKKQNPYKLSPSYDHGTAWGSDKPYHKLRDLLRDENSFENYLNKGKHHLHKHNIKERKNWERFQHVDLITELINDKEILQILPNIKDTFKSILDFKNDHVKEILEEVQSVCYNNKIDNKDSTVIDQRIDFMEQLLITRKERLEQCLKV